MTFRLPKTSFNSMKDVIQAAYMSDQRDITIPEWVAVISGKNLFEDVNRSVPFFKELGLIEPGERRFSHKLTDTLLQLGKAIRMRDEATERRIWKSIIENNLFFKQVIDRIDFSQDVNGYIEMRKLKEDIIKLAGKEEQSKKVKNYFDVYAPTIVNLLRFVKIIEVKDKLKVRRAPISPNSDFVFINSENINRLRNIVSEDFDLSRLIRYCDQINENYATGNFESVAFLSRALIHHIPPIFGPHVKNFEAVGNLTAKGNDTSFAKSCKNLQNSLKHIVDDLIHAPIAKTEIPISAQEINFSPDLNRLIREIVVKLQSNQNHKSP